jgi:ribosomal protein S18 acetylase RimI-like enzyme
MEPPENDPWHDIVVARTDDASEILKLCYLAYQREGMRYGDWTIPPLSETYASVLADCATRNVLIARSGTSIAGTIRAVRHGDVVDVYRLAVHPRFERRGLGSKLLTAVEARFPGADRFALFTGHESYGNLRLYARHGYREVRREVASPVASLVFLEKTRTG